MWSGGNHGRSLSSRVCCGSALVVRSRLRQAEDGTHPRDTYAVAGYNSAWQFHLSQRGIFNPGLAFWAKAYFCCTLVTNVLVTGLIAGRIWAHGRKFDRSVGSLPSMRHRYWAIMAIVVESGAIYSSALIIEIVLYVSKTNAIYVLFDGMAQVIVSTASFGLMVTDSNTGIYRELYQR